MHKALAWSRHLLQGGTLALSYLNFNLEITASAGGFRVKVASPGGEAAVDIPILLPPDAGAWLAALGEVSAEARDLLATTTAGSPATNPATAALALGQALFQRVFTGGVDRCFARSLDECARQDQGLRIVLRLDDAPDLTALPWEFLYDSVGSRYLAHSDKTPVVRYIDVEETLQALRVTPPLRILVLISSPSDRPSLAVEAEWAGLKAELLTLEQRGLAVLERMDQATVSMLERRLRHGERCHIFHFIGHGGVDATTNQGVLVFEDDEGRARPVGADALGMLLHDHRSLRLALLNACRSARPGSADPMTGMAQKLIQQGLPAVIAMQFPITDRGALVLSREFYGALGDGSPVDEALAHARKLMALDGFEVEWGTPVLYMRASDGRIFDVAVGSATPLPGALPTPEPAPPLVSEAPRSPEQPTGSSSPDVLPPPLPPNGPSPGNVAAAPEPEPPPPAPDFVGRESEIAYFSSKLTDHHLAVITGMPGVGKTTLAAVLARRMAPLDKIFWHAFRPGESIDAIIWKLAAFLAHHGQNQLWDILSRALSEGHPPPPTPLLFDYLFPMLRGNGYLLCFDDLQHVADDPQMAALIKRLQETVQAGELVLVVTSRDLPGFVKTVDFEVLDGLSLTDTQALLNLRGASLPPDLVTRLQAVTEGNPCFINLAVNAIKEGDDPRALVDRLSDSDHIEEYLLQTVDGQLQAAEMRVMYALAVVDRPASRELIEAVLESKGLRRPLLKLGANHLLLRRMGPSGEAFWLHAILQRHFYDHDDLTTELRQKMHGQAAAYYAATGQEPLRAARHHMLAGQAAEAARLCVDGLWTLVGQGQAREAEAFLAGMTAKGMLPLLWVDLNIARGRLGSLLGLGSRVRPALDESLRVLEDLPDDAAVRLRKARACRGIGECLHYEAPREALVWLDRGLAALSSNSSPLSDPDTRMETAALEMKLGAVRLLLQENEAAAAALQRALALLPNTASQVRGNALVSLAAIHGRTGDLEQAREFSKQALQVGDALGDDFLRIDPLLNLGIIADLDGDWTSAIKMYGRARDIAGHLGDVARRAKVALNLGVLTMNQGDDATAETYLREGIELATESRLQAQLLEGMMSLIDLRLRQGALEDAARQLAEAQAVAEKFQVQGIKAELERHVACLALDRRDAAGAKAAAERAIALADASGATGESAKARCVLGQAQLAMGDIAAALTSLQESFERLKEEDLYEAARAKLQWGRALYSSGQNGAGRALVREAYLVLKGLGAARDIAAAEALLSAIEA